MKKHFTLPLVISILGIITISIWLYLKYSNANNRLNQVEGILQVQKSIILQPNISKPESLMKIDSLARLLEVQELKEDYYLSQLEVLSDWFILYVTGIFVVIGLAGYFVFTSNIKRLEEKVAEHEKRFEEQIEQYKKSFKAVELDYWKTLSAMHILTGDIYFQNKNWQFALSSSLMALRCLSFSEANKKLNSNEKFVIDYRIKVIIESLDHMDKYPIDRLSLEQLNVYFRTMVQNFNDEDIRRKVFDLWKKIEEKTEVVKAGEDCPPNVPQ